MLFNSPQFLLFFAVVFLLYYMLAERYRWALLLMASCLFYMAFVPAYILILFGLITGDYWLGLLIARAHGRSRGWLLFISIIANLSTLFFFKYFNFFQENVVLIAQAIHWNYPFVTLSILLPLGLSFHTFQSLSYVIEVYRGKQEPERHFGIYALYVMFFPQLVAGPIERPQHMLHQFHAAHPFDATKVRRGLELMLWGLFKKMVIADKLAVVVDGIYADPHATGTAYLLAAILFSYQIYCDFSGYSDIAVGSALVLGYDLMQNFNRPFAARSMPELWRRWHISLSSWLRDYLYYPLAYTWRRSSWGVYVSLFVTFVLIGLWHGANWTFVAFGALHGVYMISSQGTGRLRKKLVMIANLAAHPRIHHILQTLSTFILVSIALVFFRAPTIEFATHVFATILNELLHPIVFVADIVQLLPRGMVAFSAALTFSALALLEAVQYLQSRTGTPYILESVLRPVRWGLYYGLILAILFLGVLRAHSFIYFQF